MPESIRIPIEEQSQTADARRIARGVAANLGFDETQSEQVAITVTEICTNLIKHGRGGEILIRATGEDSKGTVELEVLSLDKGPGMRNIEQCLSDGYSTGGSPGQGMGAIARLSTSTDIYSEAGRGVALLARWSPTAPKTAEWTKAGPLHTGAVNVCKPGQEVCGDSWGVEQDDEGATVLVADGLGHGLEAKTASMEAVRVLRSNPRLSPGALAERAHQALRNTRGAALAVARIDRIRNRVIFSGIGNIAAQIYSGVMEGPRLVSGHGTAGFQTPRVREFEYAWPEYGMLLLFSDGLGTHAGLTGHPGLALHDATLIAGVLYRDFSRGNDDSTAVVIKEA